MVLTGPIGVPQNAHYRGVAQATQWQPGGTCHSHSLRRSRQERRPPG